MGYGVLQAFERTRPQAQSLKIKPLEKYQFSNLVRMGHTIYHLTQKHETDSNMYHLSSYRQGIKILLQKTKILSVFGHFCQIDFIRSNLFLHFQKLEEIAHPTIPNNFKKNTISSFFVRFKHDAPLIQSKIASSEYRTTALRFLEKLK